MNPVVEIIRLEESFRFGTFGVMKINKEVFCVTLENPDIENKPFESSIPAEQYLCKRIHSSKYGECFRIENVTGRLNCLFLPGNIVEHTEGCIIVAEHYGKLKGDRAVLNSGKTYNKFMELLRDFDWFHLTIAEVY